MSATYSFQDVSANITGPTGEAQLGYGSHAAKEGITIEWAADKNKMEIGADGNGQHNLSADKSGTITVRLLKTSPENALLQAMYDAQALSSTLWGQNVIIVSQTAAGDLHAARDVAFRRNPRKTYAQDADLVEWTFDAIRIDSVLGTY